MDTTAERRNGRIGARKSAAAPRPAQATEVAPVIVKQNRYCELTGDTPDAVHMRRRRGEWIDDRHSHLISGRRLWINLPEVNAWLRSNGLQAN
ncbi:MAG: hypothetical protein V9E93_08735 [Steroidobacteraceae bacterium]|nr:excisionase [Pseudomonadota bacterium]MBP6107464.1 hypothetical protein [Steroidobacteraceae bacterium]MBP7014677.1 hypothetical protein [Steroidobacteraceae bacterium]